MPTSHESDAMGKDIDLAQGTVTLAPGPVKSLE